MKSVYAWVGKAILAVVLGIMVILPYGCSSAQLGETAAEGNRRHRRLVRIQQSEIMADIDMVLMLDEPSRLTDKRIP